MSPILFLVGFMGAGKSEIGRRVAAELGRPFLDLDDAIVEEAGRSIEELFRTEGEAGFRLRETDVLLRRAGIPGSVVALGGGTFGVAANREIVAGRGIAVWLDCSLATALERARHPGRPARPLLADPRELRRLYEIRRSHYALAEHRVDTERLSPIEAARHLADWFTRRSPGGGPPPARP